MNAFVKLSLAVQVLLCLLWLAEEAPASCQDAGILRKVAGICRRLLKRCCDISS